MRSFNYSPRIRQNFKFFYIKKLTKLNFIKNKRLLNKVSPKSRVIMSSNHFFARQIFILVGNLSRLKVFFSLSQRFPFFYCFRLLYLCLYNSTIVSRVFRLRKYFRIKFLF